MPDRPPQLDTGTAAEEHVAVVSVSKAGQSIAILMLCSRHPLTIHMAQNSTEEQQYQMSLEVITGSDLVVENALK